MLSMLMKKQELPTKAEALEGRETAILTPQPHVVLGTSIVPPYPSGFRAVRLGMGCFWGAERLFWQLDGVWTTSVGYAGGYTKNASYREVCSGATGHTEVVEVVFDPQKIDFSAILKVFWENHDPTQGMRQGNDIGTQYRSAVYTDDEAMCEQAQASLKAYQKSLSSMATSAKSLMLITTEVRKLTEYYRAEDEHQQYLHKNPGGYCGLKGTGVAYKDMASIRTTISS